LYWIEDVQTEEQDKGGRQVARQKAQTIFLGSSLWSGKSDEQDHEHDQFWAGTFTSRMLIWAAIKTMGGSMA
jgi:hypothetical protein